MFDITIWLVLLGLTIFSLGFAELYAHNDSNKILEDEYIVDHSSGAIIRILFITLVCTILRYSELINTLDTFLLIAYGCAVFWIWFEIRLNTFLGKDIFYVGKTAWLDKTARKVLGNNNTGRKLLIIKIAFVIFLPIGIILTK